ncbi:MAG: sugar transferase [Myxococcales bacterium]|nr:sugar transferase [Myxococcales bacterium]
MRLRTAVAKRCLDVIGSAAGLVVFAPVLLVVSLLLRAAHGPLILFRQQRPGRHGKPFWIVKFRTMREGTGPDGERLTTVGKWLRSTSLDELPELFNVLRGEMSLVGPRPLPTRYLERYSPEQARRHNVKPGITGLVQVSGRNLLSWDEKFELDVWYVDNWSLWLDVKILFRTLWHVARRKGIHAQGEATMREFPGS